jgi:hypothetical protein
MATWPSSLPCIPTLDSYAETFAETALRTSMEVGPAKVRRRISANVKPLSSAIDRLTSANVDTLETFYQTTLLGGTEEFDYVHVRTGATVSCRFVKPPKITARKPPGYRADLDLEIMP